MQRSRFRFLLTKLPTYHATDKTVTITRFMIPSIRGMKHRELAESGDCGLKHGLQVDVAYVK